MIRITYLNRGRGYCTSCDLKELVRKFISEMIGKEIEKATSSIYPLQNGFIRKVKILKAPKFDLGKLMEAFKGMDISNSPDYMEVNRAVSREFKELLVNLCLDT
ncbi:hypothetical protein VNO77_41681 [Canavalia gladiata]|uniref:Ribosomal protein S3a n=1 Tax=Canavalia gladiata TaxID=3824 RepID=A0AAN9K1F2_CANGL